MWGLTRFLYKLNRFFDIVEIVLYGGGCCIYKHVLFAWKLIYFLQKVYVFLQLFLTTVSLNGVYVLDLKIEVDILKCSLNCTFVDTFIYKK